MYVLYTHRACSCGCDTVCLLACETVGSFVLVVVWAQKPNVVQVLVENLCGDIFCEYVCDVVQGTDLVH